VHRFSSFLVLIVPAVLLAACAPRRTVYTGGPVLTMDVQDRVVEAIGVENDRIGAVGTEAEVRAWAGDGAAEVDLHGRALLPGFIDAHGHFPGAGVYARAADLNSPPIGGVRTIDDLVERLRAQAESSGDWVIGLGYDDTLLQPARHPSWADLDRVSAARPVAAIHISAHLAAVNSVGLERLGIAANTPDPEGGRIQRDDAGAATGVLEETAAQPVIERLLRPGLFGSLAILREGSGRALSAGVTTAQVGYATRDALAIVTASRLGLVPLRLVIWPSVDLAIEELNGKRSLRSSDEDWVRFGAVKLIADGSIQGYTAYLGAPYHVPPGDAPDFRGYSRYSKEELRDLVVRLHAAGKQIAVHGNGDAAIDDILDAIDTAQRQTPRSDARPVIVHAQTARPDQLDRMRALGVVPSFFVLHTYYWGDRHRDRFLGPERAARISPAASALARGIRFTLHCDAPVVPLEPLRLVWAAVNRRSTGGAVIGPEERIPVMAALRAITIDAARQHFEEARKGSLEPGKLADLVILSRSPLDDPEHIDAIVVDETIVGGRTAYRREDTIQ
jgi:predicted amidohydrolase YtcJ